MDTPQGVEIYATKIDLEILRGEMKEGFATVAGEMHLLKWMVGMLMSLMLPLIAGLALLIIKQFFGSP